MADDQITVIRKAIAAMWDSWALDETGSLVKAYATAPDSLTPPAAVVESTAIRWANTGRTGSTAVVDITVTVFLPQSSTPVGALLASRVMSQARTVHDSGGKTLGGVCAAYRLLSASTSTGSIGERVVPTVEVFLEVWL